MKSLPMYNVKNLVVLTTFVSCLLGTKTSYCQSNPDWRPQLIKQDGITQLYVDQKPFLILGGELNNSSSSNITYMQPLWKQAKALHFNTLITPLSWELVEPKEGAFDFTLVDSLIVNARQN